MDARVIPAVIGLTMTRGLDDRRRAAVTVAQQEVLRRARGLVSLTLSIGETRLDLWGRGELARRVGWTTEGALLVLLGSSPEFTGWMDAPATLRDADYSSDVELPWNGRLAVIKVSSDGLAWTLWSDWSGSVPVFHAALEGANILSTIEPAVVAGVGFDDSDLDLAALISLLVNGHSLADWTLHKDIRITLPDAVCEWSGGGFRSRPLHTIEPTEARWHSNWDDLIDELHALCRSAVTGALTQASSWALTLSGGLDSRLIAGIAAEVGADIRAYTWGPRDSQDVEYARRVAKVLGLPWQRVDLGTDYLRSHARDWMAQFGGTLHAHGMYQIAFYHAIRDEPPAPVLSGFLGDVLMGAGGASVVPDECRIMTEGYVHWTADEVRRLLRVPHDQALAAVTDNLRAQLASFSGAHFQRTTLIDFRNRGRCFTSFQTSVADLWRGVATPFLNQALARFCLSLSRPVLEDRRLLAEVYRRFYGPLAALPGTAWNEPYTMSGRYLVARRLADALPRPLRRGPLRMFGAVAPVTDVDSARVLGWDAFWPIPAVRDRLSHWLDAAVMDGAFAEAVSGRPDLRQVRRLQSIQAFAQQLFHSRALGPPPNQCH